MCIASLEYSDKGDSEVAQHLDVYKRQGYAYLFIEGYLVQDHDMILRAIELAKEAGLQVCLDMASYNICLLYTSRCV